jgi:hypothetical protein
LSTGKTSLIRYLLERDYPGLRIGPEPTTDCFNAVMYGDQEQVINKLTNIIRTQKLNKYFSWNFALAGVLYGVKYCRQIARQKMCQKISVIKSNSFDNIKKIVDFGILIHFLSQRQ